MSTINSLLSNQLYGRGLLVNNQFANRHSTNLANAMQQSSKSFDVNISAEGLKAFQSQNQNQSQNTTANVDTGVFTNKELSTKAQSLLEKLRENYGNYNFIIADDVEEADIQSLTADSDKEYSVILTSEELEKMANDEKYANSMMGKVEDAVKMADDIMNKVDFGDKAQISQIIISFDNDGNTKFSATLEKLSESQNQRLENAKARRAEEVKQNTEQVKNPQEQKSNSFTINANTEEDFFEQLKQINWDEMFSFNEKFATE